LLLEHCEPGSPAIAKIKSSAQDYFWKARVAKYTAVLYQGNEKWRGKDTDGDDNKHKNELWGTTSAYKWGETAPSESFILTGP
jgi:hypothetical protein